MREPERMVDQVEMEIERVLRELACTPFVDRETGTPTQEYAALYQKHLVLVRVSMHLQARDHVMRPLDWQRCP